MITIIKIIFLLGFLIILHEFAHYIVARLCKVKVNEFSVGFGKKILQKEVDKTVYTLRLIPLGGYVSLKGLDEKSSDPDSYTSVSIWKRMLIILAGGFANILFGLITFFILITALHGINVGIVATGDFFFSIFESLKMLFTGEVGLDQFTGPIGISSVVSETKALTEFIYLLSLVSLSLGVTNLLPIPPLDGFKFLLLLIEKIRRKPFSEKFEINMQFLGFVLLFGLSIYVAYNDVLRIF